MKKMLTAFALSAMLLTGGSSLASGQGKTLDEEQVDPGITSGKANREFEQAREKWLGWGVRNYRMKVSRSCFCASPFEATITVRKGKPVEVSERPWYGPKTVPAMFQIINQAIKRKVAVLDVKYDGRLGFPTRASIDYIAMAADDEIGYRITGFKQL